MGNYCSKYTGEQFDMVIGAVLAGKAVLLTNCPNCGAPIDEGKCPYCGTSFLSNKQGVRSDQHAKEDA